MGVVSRRWMWVESMGVASGCGCKEVYHIYYLEPMSRPKGVQRHLILSSFDTFLIWTFPQVGNLPLWSLRIRVKQAQRTACRRAQSASCFSARAMRIRA